MWSAGDCADWNVTLYRFEESWPDNKLGQVIDVLCPNAEKHVFVMPSGLSSMAIRWERRPFCAWTLNELVVLRLQAWNSHLADYRLTWQISVSPSPDPGIQRSLSALITTSVPAAGQLDSSVRNVSGANLMGASLHLCTLIAITSYLITWLTDFPVVSPRISLSKVR